MIAHWKKFFAPITTSADAEQALKELEKGWYVVGIVMIVMCWWLFISGETPVLNLVDGSFYVGAGYFLPRKKSRAFACIVFLWSAAAFLLTLANKAGLYGGVGKNAFLGLIVVGMAYRSIKATWIYQKGARTSWKNVAIISALATLGSIVMFVLTEIFLLVKMPAISDDDAGTYLLLPLMIVWALCYGALTKKFPLSQSLKADS